MSDEYRFGDETPPEERSERLYQEEPGGAWYFRTREGAPMGPFETAGEAEQALNDFIEFIRLADLQTLSELTQSLAADGGSAADDEGLQDQPAPDEVARVVDEAAHPTAVVSGSSTVAGRSVDRTAADGVGAWDPRTVMLEPSVALLNDLQERFLANGQATARGVLTGAEVERLSGLMRCEPALWPPLLVALDAEALIALIRFFTLAEHELPGWEAGRKSPAIACARALRQRGSYPHSLTAWIRQHSDNRFLPYGSVLDPH